MGTVEKLQQVLDEAVDSGEECGCQLAVYQHGKLLCSLYSGFATPDKKIKVDENTLFPVFSVGKGIMAALMHILHEQGFYDYDDLAGSYWQEYACNGKEMTSILHVLTHRSGLYQFPDGMPFEEQFQWAKACSVLASMASLDCIGGKHHYHARTFGVLTGRLAELMTGEKLQVLLEKNIFDVLGIDRIFFGLPETRFRELALIDDTAHANSYLTQFNQMSVLGGLNPSSNGCANALSLAKLYAALLPEGVEGKSLLKSQTVENATILRRTPDDPVLPEQWTKFGLGWVLCGPDDAPERMFGHGGACGSEAFADKKSGLAVGFTKNRVSKSHPNHQLRNQISRILGIPERIW